MTKKHFLLMLMLFSISITQAQTPIITGKVTDLVGEPLEGVTVTLKGTDHQVITKSDGTYQVEAEIGQSLIFSLVGISNETRLIKTSEPINVQMDLNFDLEEVVVTGYQTERKKDITGAVSVVNVADIKDIPVGNPMKALQGRVPGVFITSDGSPQGGANVRIRGIGTLGNNDPLYVIDGIPTQRGLQELNQADIESIQVLKDASSATMYGSRAANGVIIVTTKKAKKGVNQVNFNSSVSTQAYTTKMKMLDTYGRGKAYWQSAVNDGEDPNNHPIYQYDWSAVDGQPVLDGINLPEFIDESKTMSPGNTNWYDEVSQAAIIQSYDLSISNGNERGNSLFSISHYDNKGIIRGSNSQRLTARANTSFNFFNDKIRIGENLSTTYINNTLIPIGDIMYLALVQQPLVPVHSVDGGWGGPGTGMSDRHNPVRLIEDNRQNHNYFFRIFGNAFIEAEIIPHLKFMSNLGIDYNTNYERTLRKSYTTGFLSDLTNQVRTANGINGDWVWQNTLNYNLNTGKNTIDFLLGSEQIRFINQSFWGSRKDYTLEDINYAYLDAGAADKDNGGIGSSYSLMSYFTKVNYAFDDKYLASVTIRRDGSSRFGNENRYGVFPAFSLGWRLSEEQFLKNALPFVSDLKLRYGWGKAGNQEIANNAAYTLYAAIYGTDAIWDFDQGSAYDLNGAGQGQLPAGFTLIQQGNNSLKWESSTQSNIGLDFGLFNNKITGSVDYFVKDASDILIQPAYLAVVGEGGNQWKNGASMTNKGIEFLISYNTNIGQDFSINLTANLANYQNKITHLPSEILGSYPGNGTDKTILGRSVNSLFGYVADGIFQTQEEVDAHPTQIGKGIGRIRYKNLDGNDIIDDRDRDYIGAGDPKIMYGLNTGVSYKKIDLNFFIQGLAGNDVDNSNKRLTDLPMLTAGSNWGARSLDAWTPNNTGSSIPALTLVDRNNEGRFSTYFVEKGSYLKLRNIQIGYTIDNISNLKIQNARIYLQGSNLVTLKSKSFTGPDPENPNNAYPIPAIYTIGLNVSF